MQRPQSPGVGQRMGAASAHCHIQPGQVTRAACTQTLAPGCATAEQAAAAKPGLQRGPPLVKQCARGI